MSDDPTVNTLTLVIDKIEIGDCDGELLAAIDLQPEAGTAPVAVMFYDAELGEEPRTGIGLGFHLTRKQAMLLGQFLLLAGHADLAD